MYKTGGWGVQAKLYAETYKKPRHQKIRQQIITKLGGCCCRCGFNDVRALQIDHINGGGCKERKLVGKGNEYTYYKRVLEAQSGKYQLLCANCNWIKRHENKEDGSLDSAKYRKGGNNG